MRLVLALVALLLGPLGPLVASPAAALDLDDVLCACADGGAAGGDHLSCLALLTQRLVANGTMTRAERSRLLARARLSPPVPCDPSGGEPLDGLAYGFGVEADRAFFGVGETVHARLLLWNFSDEDASFVFPSSSPARGCRFDVRIVDASGLALHQVSSVCDAAIGMEVVPAGSRADRAVDVPLVTMDAATGAPDGVPLPPGAYWLEASLAAIGSGVLEGHPVARLPIRVE